MKPADRRQFLELATGVAALPFTTRIALAQIYPSRPITIVVPYPPGGAADTITRILTERMRVSLRQTVIIENVSGANGSIGVGRVARAPPDGYTLVLGLWNTHVANGALYALPYDVINDFVPISPLTSQPYLIVAKRNFAARDLKGFIAWLKANPDRASAGTQGLGGASQVAGVFFQKATGTRFQFVPYRGGGPAVQDLIAGQIDLMIASTGDALEQARAGNIAAYAVTAKTRLAAAPDIPTVDEAGLPGFYFSIWLGLWAPLHTPKDIIVTINSATVDTLTDQTVRARLAALGQEIFPPDQLTPEALRVLQKREIEKWWPIIKAANIKGE